MGTWTLLLLIAATWVLWGVGTTQGHEILKREGKVRPDSHTSLAPIIPLCPLFFFGLAKLIDWPFPPWGTRIIGGLHAILLIAFLITIFWQAFRHKHGKILPP